MQVNKRNFSKSAFSLIELSIVILIIGILIAGVTQSSRLINAMRLASARAQTQSSPINSIPGIFAWYETTSENAFDVQNPDDGQVVTTWNDLNPLSPIIKNPLSQTTVGAKPTYKNASFNGLPSLYFDGGDYLSISSISSSVLLPNTQSTIFIVFNISSISTLLFSFQTSASNRYALEINTSLPRFDCVNDTSGSLVGSTNVVGTPTIVTLYKSANTQSIYVNGSLNATQSNSQTLTAFSGELDIGKYIDGGYLVSGNIAELVIYDHALKNEERQSIEKYLGKKWGIALN